MKKFLLLLIIISVSTGLKAQQEGRMETDRPDQTESPFLTKHYFIQAEAGFNYEITNKLQTIVHPTLLWKYGLTRKVELRVITEAVTTETGFTPPSGKKENTGLLPVQLGAKLALTEEKKWLPKTSLIFHVAPSKLGSRKFHTSKWSPNFRFVMQNTLTEKIGLGYNLGAEWDGESNSPSWIYTFAPGFNIGERWYGYLEVFGSLKRMEEPEHAFDGGLAYYFSEHSKIDISAGFGLSKAAIDHYVAIGYSFRFNLKKEKK